MTDGSVATLPNGVARDVFAVRYRGGLPLPELETRLRARLRDALQVMHLRPGACIIPDAQHLPTAVEQEDGDAAADAVVGVLDLAAMSRELVRCAGELGTLWARCLQARAPSLWMQSQGGGGGGVGWGAPTESQAAKWLSELRDFLLLRLRESAGGVQLDDGVRLRDLSLGPELGNGAYGVVHLARSKVLPDRFYAVKVLHKHKLKSRSGQAERKAMERERELLLLLARECRGSHHRELYVRLLTSGHDATSLQLVMPAVLGGELFHLLEEHGEMEEVCVTFRRLALSLSRSGLLLLTERLRGEGSVPQASFVACGD